VAPGPARRRAGTALLAYGSVGIVLLGGFLAVLLFTAVQAQDVLSTLDASRDEVVAALDDVTAALQTSGETLNGVSASLEETGSALIEAGRLAAIIGPGTSVLADQAESFSIFGQRPLEGMASPLRDASTSLEALSARLDAAGISIDANAPSVETLGTRLAGVAGSLQASRDRLAQFDLSLGVWAYLALIAFVVLVIWLMVPAIVAFWIGRRWRRENPTE
jgi:hypothetical protein